MSKQYTHVFLSYSHENKEEVRQLRDDLLNAGEQVWWDEDIPVGKDWQQAIRRAMNASYAFVVCLSKETEAATESGIYPELLEAIRTYRNHAAGEVFLMPVRLSECQIPDVEIDASRTLDRLQHTDLFPPDKRSEGLRRLLESIGSSARHP